MNLNVKLEQVLGLLASVPENASSDAKCKPKRCRIFRNAREGIARAVGGELFLLCRVIERKKRKEYGFI